MINSISTMLNDRLQLQKEQMSMALMKNRMQADQAMAQMLMETAKNIQQITASSTGADGSVVDMYV